MLRATWRGLETWHGRDASADWRARSSTLPVLHTVACDQVRGARGRGQGTETLAQLGGLPASDACVCAQHLEAGLDPRRPGQRMAAPHRLSTDRGDIPAGRCLRQRRRAGTGRHRPYYIPNVRCENGTAANSGMHRFHSASMRKPRMRRGVATWLGSGKLLGR